MRYIGEYNRASPRAGISPVTVRRSGVNEELREKKVTTRSFVRSSRGTPLTSEMTNLQERVCPCRPRVELELKRKKNERTKNAPVRPEDRRGRKTKIGVERVNGDAS